MRIVSSGHSGNGFFQIYDFFIFLRAKSCKNITENQLILLLTPLPTWVLCQGSNSVQSNRVTE